MAGGAVTFRLDRLAMAVNAAELAAWVDGAAPGAQTVYAWGPARPSREAAVILADQLQRQGVLQLNQRRVEGMFEYVATRIGAAPAAAAAADDPKARVLAELMRAAQAGQPCPNDRELATACRLKNREAARNWRRALVREGAITIMGEAFGRPVVTIVATGARTAAQ